MNSQKKKERKGKPAYWPVIFFRRSNCLVPQSIPQPFPKKKKKRTSYNGGINQ